MSRHLSKQDFRNQNMPTHLRDCRKVAGNPTTGWSLALQAAGIALETFEDDVFPQDEDVLAGAGQCIILHSHDPLRAQWVEAFERRRNKWRGTLILVSATPGGLRPLVRRLNVPPGLRIQTLDRWDAEDFRQGHRSPRGQELSDLSNNVLTQKQNMKPEFDLNFPKPDFPASLGLRLLREARVACDDKDHVCDYNRTGITIHAPTKLDDWSSPFGEDQVDALSQLAQCIVDEDGPLDAKMSECVKIAMDGADAKTLTHALREYFNITK